MPTRPTTSSSPAWPASAWPLCFRVVLGDKRSSGASVRIRPGWNAPIGGVLLAVCGLIALAGFPLDDIWHRLFGQDVTLWGPTHIQMAGGTLGLAAEWAWSHVWMALPWHASLLPEGAALPFVAAVTGGLIGGLIGRALAPDGMARQPIPRGSPAVIAVVALACIAIPLPMTARSYRTDMALTDVAAPGGRHVAVDLRLTPPNAANHANWFTVTAWQGAGNGNSGLVVAPLRQVAPAEYRTTTPIPVYGKWKAIVRLQKGTTVDSVPIYLPADPAIPAPAVNADAHISRTFVAEKKVLQREAIGGSVGLQRLAYALLAMLGLVGSERWAGASGGLTRPPRHPPAETAAPAAQVRPSRQREFAT